MKMSYDRVLIVHVMGSDSRYPRSVSIKNRTLGCFISRKDYFSEIKERAELERPAVYLLIGETNDEGATSVYVGETDNFAERIKDHIRKKDWWNQLVVFHSNDFTKAEVKYLEKELWIMAKNSIGTLTVRNDKDPSGTSLPQHQIAAIRETKDDIVFILETLGLTFFDVITKSHDSTKVVSTKMPPVDQSKKHIFYMTLPRDLSANGEPNLQATMSFENGSYILKAGSYIKKESHNSLSHNSSYSELWKQVIESDSVKEVENPKILQVVKDIEFKSPSAAGTVVRARPTNGRTDWKRLEDDLTFHEVSLEILKV